MALVLHVDVVVSVAALEVEVVAVEDAAEAVIESTFYS